jgi:hypothetical protein
MFVLNTPPTGAAPAAVAASIWLRGHALASSAATTPTA